MNRGRATASSAALIVQSSVSHSSKIITIGIVLLIAVSIFTLYEFFIVGIRIHGTRIVYESKPLGFFQNDYNHASQIDISNFQPEEITKNGSTINELESKYNGKIIKWNLKVDEAFDSFTDVIGNCYRVLQINPADAQQILISIDYQGTNCKFWKAIQKGDSITVIGEIEIHEVVMANRGPRKTEIINDVRPMAIKHNNNYYLNGSLPQSIKNQLLERMDTPRL